MSPSSTTNAQHKKKVFAEIAEAEAEVFRIGQVARQLITEHPALRALEVGPRTRCEAMVLDVWVDSAADLRAWAEAIGGQVVCSQRAPATGSVSLRCEATVTGVPVYVWAISYDAAEVQRYAEVTA